MSICTAVQNYMVILLLVSYIIISYYCQLEQCVVAMMVILVSCQTLNVLMSIKYSRLYIGRICIIPSVTTT